MNFKVWTGIPQELFQVMTFLLMILRCHLPFSLFVSWMYSGVFQRLCDVWEHNRLSSEADMRIQLSSIKLEIKEISKNVKQHHFGDFIFVLENLNCYK